MSTYDSDDEPLPPPPPALPAQYILNAQAYDARIRNRESSVLNSEAGGSDSRSFMDRLNQGGASGSSRLDMDVEENEEEDLDVDEDELDDVRRMGKVWVRERGIGGIIAWEGDLVDSLFDKLEQQVNSSSSRSTRLLMHVLDYISLQLCFIWRFKFTDIGFLAKDGQYTTVRPSDVRRRAFQVDVSDDRDGTGQIPHSILCTDEVIKGK
jgi:hypothetical protein